MERKVKDNKRTNIQQKNIEKNINPTIFKWGKDQELT